MAALLHLCMRFVSLNAIGLEYRHSITQWMDCVIIIIYITIVNNNDNDNNNNNGNFSLNTYPSIYVSKML